MGMNIWKEKVLPKIKKVFEKSPGKKAQAAEVIKSFDESKEQYTTEFEEKKGELQPKVVEIYEASPPEIKALVRDPKVAGLKKNSAGVQKFLDELAKIEFPGSKPVAEAATKLGPSYLSGPITSLFEKVSPLLPEEVKEEAAAEAAAEESSAKVEEVKEKEIEVEAEKKEGVAAEAAAAAEKVEPPPPAEAAPAAAVEEVKKEEAPPPAAAAEPPKA